MASVSSASELAYENRTCPGDPNALPGTAAICAFSSQAWQNAKSYSIPSCRQAFSTLGNW
jgi:hypothetical protein